LVSEENIYIYQDTMSQSEENPLNAPENIQSSNECVATPRQTDVRNNRPDATNNRPTVRNNRPDVRNDRPDATNDQPGVRNDRLDATNDRPGATNSFSYKYPVLIFILAMYCYSWFSAPDACNMAIAENRDFNKYYGIIGSRNHFTSLAADECDTNVIFRPALPQSILKADNSASSFLTLAKYGTGKTLLRCEYFKSLKVDNYLKVLILNKQISEYIERFVKKHTENEKNSENTNCLSG
jgi:hypothetical protein